MKKIYFTPGPSQTFSSLPKYIKEAFKEDIPSISHRSKKFKDLYQETEKSLRQIFKLPKSHKIFFTSSSLESMERIIENCVEKNSFHFVNGAFAKKFYEISLDLKKNAKKLEAPYGKGFDFETVKIPKDTELVCITQNETSTGYSVNMSDIYKLKEKNRSKLFAIDIVSSAPCINIDFSKIDLAFFSVQKAFGLPAGLGVLIANDKAIRKTSKLQANEINIGSYHNFLAYERMAKEFQTPETPNVINIYLLHKVCKEILSKKLSIVRKETDLKAKLIYNFFKKHPKYKPFIKEDNHASKTTIVIDVGNDSKNIIEALKKKRLIVGSGYGKFKENHIRIANFPAIEINDVKKLLRNIK